MTAVKTTGVSRVRHAEGPVFERTSLSFGVRRRGRSSRPTSVELHTRGLNSMSAYSRLAALSTPELGSGRRKAIPATCELHRGWVGFTNLRAREADPPMCRAVADDPHRTRWRTARLHSYPWVVQIRTARL
jgi:hypothetical protein